VSGDSGDTRFARLFGYGVTDARGQCELVTVHPTGYPRTDLPSHIHLALEGRERDVRWTEIRFEDCPRMTPAVRAQSVREGLVVVPVEKTADGSLRCTAEFRLPAE
jgi:protocatechuate 3,4-dioxygenase beta subunit